MYTPDHNNRYTPEFFNCKWFFGTFSVDNFLIFRFLLLSMSAKELKEGLPRISKHFAWS